MIIVKMIGGLGNQLFQYALGRTIAHKKNTSLKIDITPFKTYKLHKYALNNFNVIENFATEEEIRPLKYPGGLRYWTSKLTQSSKLYYNQSFVKELDFTFDPNILKVPSDVYLDGYWQSEKYFKDIGSMIRREFSVKCQPDIETEKIIEQIQSVNAISLHVRRKDYVSNLDTNKIHGICSLEYYHNAMKFIANKVNSPTFYIFSDDPEWVKLNLQLDFPMTFVTHNGPEKNFEDLRLMSLCKHNIVANSTFSWWGAWLNRNPEKIVIAPRKWFNDPSINTDDLIPKNWIRI
jgi:hypothetical protein